MNKYLGMKVPRCGAMDSKYFSNFDQFEKDIEKHKTDTLEYKSSLRNLLLEDPNKLNQRYYQAIQVLTELKREFNL